MLSWKMRMIIPTAMCPSKRLHISECRPPLKDDNENKVPKSKTAGHKPRHITTGAIAYGAAQIHVAFSSQIFGIGDNVGKLQFCLMLGPPKDEYFSDDEDQELGGAAGQEHGPPSKDDEPSRRCWTLVASEDYEPVAPYKPFVDHDAIRLQYDTIRRPAPFL
ncbi:hypothetical protein B0H21DRAFT_713714 [Amylocystis lapponica]|nr:hypothetical protein B0H21DRAFT_713714 [Amylocystis lapponica]